MQKELEQTRMKFSLASQEIISLKAAVQQAQREKEQVMTSSSFIYKSITKKKQKQKRVTTMYGLHTFKYCAVKQWSASVVTLGVNVL